MSDQSFEKLLAATLKRLYPRPSAHEVEAALVQIRAQTAETPVRQIPTALRIAATIAVLIGAFAAGFLFSEFRRSASAEGRPALESEQPWVVRSPVLSVGPRS